VPNSPVILIDLDDLARTRSGGEIVVDAARARISGSATFRASFGVGNYVAHFCADFRGATLRKSGLWLEGRVNETLQAYGQSQNGRSVPLGSAGGWFQFERPDNAGDGIMVRMGLSFISRERACDNAEREIPNFDFEQTMTDSKEAWRDKLSAVQVDDSGVDSDLVTTFWSGLYRAMLSPQDYTGENPLWNSTEPYFDSFYCIWDSYRAQHPLLTLIDPSTQSRMVRALIDIYKHEGKLPDCRMSFSKGFTQGGSNADVVMADAYVKNVTGAIDWDLAYEAVVSDAEEPPENWATGGRGNIKSYQRYGYVPQDGDPALDSNNSGTYAAARTISRTVEYAYDDFSIAQMARGLGKSDDEAKYLERSTYWQNLLNADQEDDLDPSKRFKGFLQPRLRNGTFAHQHTALCSPVHEPHQCYLDTTQDTYEGSPWLYTFYAPHQMSTLISLLGGPAAFTARLDHFHESGIAYMGNEQTFLTVFQFHYAGRPGRSSYWVRRYIPSLFNSTVGGIPGNDDCAMGAFSSLAMMGLWPVAGQDVYLLTPPMFGEVSVAASGGGGGGGGDGGDGKRAVIRSRNFDGDRAKMYVQSATLDGRPYTKSWIGHEFFVRGGVLEFVLGEDEGDWGTREEDLPPSWSGG
jgi:predicted alpha-1,2-mannosidase